MTSFHSPPSSSDPTNSPSTLLPPPQTSTISSRPFPPPCWSQEETVSLIDAYRDKWYSLRRGNLRASDWQEVADEVANRRPLSSGNPQKTSTQCRHKMEKLRKRYRAEIQRTALIPGGHRYPSSWVHFKQMDLMENGSNTPSSPVNVSMHRDEDEESEERDCCNQNGLLLYPYGIKQAIPTPPNKRFHNLIDSQNGVRFKIPPPETRRNSATPSYRVGKGLTDGYVNRKRSRVEVFDDGDNPVKEMVGAINKLGDGFMRVERMKMEMAKELESMRSEMEMKRTEMIIEFHHRLVDSFSSSANKKLKRMPTPESCTAK